MKQLLLIVGIIIVIVIALSVMNRDDGATPTDTATNTPAEQSGTLATNTQSTETATEDHEGMDAIGNDAGMEFPTTDEGSETALAVDPNAKVFTLLGSNFKYDVPEIRVKEGDTVVINFTSADGFHDWVVDEFEARTAKVQTGGTSSVTFVADKKGTFEYYCSVGQHRANGMVGNLIVE